MIDILKLSRTHGIQIATEGSKHCRRGWVQFQCPFCRTSKWHLGFNLERGYFNCWNCGRHKLGNTVQRLLNSTEAEAWDAIRAVSSDTVIMPRNTGKSPAPRRKALRVPRGLGAMPDRHKTYLKTRHFNPDKLEYLWGLQGLGQNTEARYRWRIFIPVEFEGKLVTYQCRGISQVQVPPYLACDADREVRPIKECLYGYDLVPSDKVVVVEGVADVWRLGPGAVATFGTSWVQAQVNLLKSFAKVYIAFDPEDEAQRKARKLAYALTGLGPDVELIDFETDTDPGDMDNQTARAAMRELGL